MKKKVWLVIRGLKDGGAENLAREYAQFVNSDQFEATIVTMYPHVNYANYRRAVEAGLRMISVFERRNVFTRAINKLLGKWYIPFRLKQMLTREAPDVIHFNSPMAVDFMPVSESLVGRRLVYTCHTEVQKQFSPEEDAAVRELITQQGICLIGLHEDMRKKLNDRFGVNNTVVIKNGVDIERFRRYERPNIDARQAIAVPKNAFVVGHVGRFSQVKNHAFLLSVFKEITRRKTNAHLLLIGDGSLELEIQRQIRALELESQVTILSHRTDVPELLSAMDVMIFPSFYEGLSVTLVEAQASGLRCVVSDSINQENFLLETTIPMSLNSSAAAWAEAALDIERRNVCCGNIEDYDMKREIRRLEKVYCGDDPD